MLFRSKKAPVGSGTASPAPATAALPTSPLQSAPPLSAPVVSQPAMNAPVAPQLPAQPVATNGTPAVTAKPTAKPTPEVMQQRAEQSRGVQRALGGILAVLLRSAGHRHLTVADIEASVAPAVATGQFALAEATHSESGLVRPIAFLLWASVSPAIDAGLQETPEQRFPTNPAEWRSGDIVWIVDAGGDQKIVAQMIEQQKAAAWKGRTVRLRVAGEGGRITATTLAERPAA